MVGLNDAAKSIFYDLIESRKERGIKKAEELEAILSSISPEQRNIAIEVIRTVDAVKLNKILYEMPREEREKTINARELVHSVQYDDQIDYNYIKQILDKYPKN